ncbi:MAG TPA: glycosyltransferase family 39 protein [Terriglobales bacterium]|nr:glycosyltransferase family 39 protein [Terriglobales bacterium]
MTSTPAVHSTTPSAALPATVPHSRLRCWIPAILLVVYVAQCAWFIRTQSFTFDEPVHIVTGLEMWRYGRIQDWNDHPPLQRLLCTLPLIGQKWRVDVKGHFPEFTALAFHPGPQQMADRGRAVSVVLGIILALVLWTTTRRLYSEQAANLALGLFAFSPALIAHYSLITTDGVGVLMIFATAVQLLHWRHNPTRGQTALLGLVMGLLLLAKFYTPPMFLVALGWLLLLKPEKIAFHPFRWNWRAAVAVCAIAFMVLWAGYFFHVSHLTMRDGTFIATFPHREPIIKKMRTPVNFSIPVPAGEYLEGLRNVAFHNHRGHQAFFLGTASLKGGWRLYYPAVVVLKWPTVVVLLFLVALLIAATRRISIPRDFLIMASFPAVYFVFAIFSHIDIGDRHVLPIYPFVLLFVAGGCWQLARRSRTALVLVVIALALNAADALRYAPDYLSYFTPFVPPSQTYKLLSDSNLDWGQGLLALRRYEAAHPQEKIYLAYFGSVDPGAYGLRARLLPEDQRVSGATVVVSATELTGQMLDNFGDYHWVLQYPQKAILNHSLHVFQIPPQEVPGKTSE